MRLYEDANLHMWRHVHSNAIKGFTFSLGGAVLLSSNYVVAKFALRGFEALSLGVIWTWSATFWTFMLILVTGQLSQVRLPQRSISRVLCMGISNASATYFAWKSLSYLDPPLVAFLWRFLPVLAILLSVLFLKETLTAKEVVPIVVMVLGSFVSGYGRWRVVGLGVTFSLLACCALAVHNVMAKMEVGNINSNVLVLYRCAIAAACLSLVAATVGSTHFDVERPYWIAAFFGALIGPCCGYLLTFRSYRYWGLSRSSIVLISQPLIVLVISYLVFGTFPSEKELVGGAVILTGGLWLSLVHLKKKKALSPREAEIADQL